MHELHVRKSMAIVLEDNWYELLRIELKLSGQILRHLKNGHRKSGRSAALGRLEMKSAWTTLCKSK